MRRGIVSYAILAAMIFIGSVSTAHADVITWTLNNVVFSDGGTASGTFSIDSVTGDLLTYDVTTVQTTTGYTGWVYNPSIPFPFSSYGNSTVDGDGIDLYPTGENDPYILQLAFANSLSTPGTDQLLLGPDTVAVGPRFPVPTFPYSYEQGFNDDSVFTRFVISGDATSSVEAAVPEPGTYTMMLAGLGLIALLRRRKQFSA